MIAKEKDMKEQLSENETIDTTGSEKVGVYICYCGGNISDHVDVEAVRERMEQRPDVTVSRTNMFMCSDPGQELIIDDLKSGKVDRVVVASCAPSLHETTFRSAIERAGGNPYIYEHANIREQVSWVHHGDSATDKAATLVGAAAAKASLLKPLDPVRVDAKKHTTVIGGGISGMTTALGIADKGIDVTLIENQNQLGGQLTRLGHLAPTGEDAALIVESLCRQIEAHDRISVHTGCDITDVTGYVGNFTVSLNKNQTVSDTNPPAPLKTGTIVMATGAHTYALQGGEFGFNRSSMVISLETLINHLKPLYPLNGGTTPSHTTPLTFNGRMIRSIAMIHCVGSRQIPGIHKPGISGYLNEYCSRTCCSAMLNASVTIRKRFPGTTVYEMYRDIRTYGRGQEELYHRASKNKVIFMRFEAGNEPEVSLTDSGHDGDYPLRVSIQDTLTFNEQFDVPVDLVVLATGIEPNDVTSLVKAMKIPVGTDRFLLEVHPKLRPVEFPVAGIFLAGSCQAPMDVGEASNAAGAAAAKAAALLDKGYIELPPFVAEVNETTCTGCGDCVDACIKEGALNMVDIVASNYGDGQTDQDDRPDTGENQKRVAQVTPAICLGCGACVAVCEEGAIDLNGWALQQYEKMVDAIVADGMAA